MSCEIFIDTNAEEWSITIDNDDACDEIDITVELEGETLPSETDPVFLAHPAYGIDATDISNLHAPYSDAETASTIGTLLGTQSAATPGSSDVFPFVQAVGNTLKKITLTNLAAALNTEAGAEPLFMSSPAYGITTGDIDNWDTAYGWGDHSAQGYTTTGDLLDYSTTGHDHDTLYEAIGSASAEVATHESTYNHGEYDTAYGWGDHSTAGYATTGDLIDYSTTGHDHDIVYDAIGSASAEVATHELTYDHGTFITSGDIPTETDPVFTASPAASVTTGDIAEWNIAYGWGDHSTAGYSTTGHDHDTLYDIIGAASAEVEQHELDYDHTLIATALQPSSLNGYTTTGDLLDYSTTGHDHDTLYDSIGAASGAVGQHEIDYDHTLIAEAMPKATQITSITLASGSWGASGDLYEYDYANAAITADTIVDVIPDNEYIAVVKAAEILPKTVSSAGSVKLYATNAPTGNIGVTINITTKQ